jgi:hypothetical protein
MISVCAGCLLLLVIAGCADPLARTKDFFAEGAQSDRFDAAQLSKMEDSAGEVMSHPERFGDEGVAQACGMLAYAYVYAGEYRQAKALLAQLEMLVDPDKLSPAATALLTIVRADGKYEEALELADQDFEGHAGEIQGCFDAAIAAYEGAQSGEAFAAEPTLRQLFALRQSDILLSIGNLWAVYDGDRARPYYTRALEVSVKASAYGPDLRGRLLERAAEARRLLAREEPEDAA